MQTLRNAKYLARFVLAWFVLSLGVAVASPLVKPQAMEPICSAAGVVKIPVKVDGGSQTPARHTLDCPVCVPVSAPPPVARLEVASLPAPTNEPQSMAAAPCAETTGAPPPARGPPAHS